MSGVPPQPPVAGEPAWLPDPTGRHQLRWFDGHGFTDQVADDGETSVDPFAPAPTRPAGPSVGAEALPADVTGRPASKLPVILAAVGAFVVVLALLVLLTGDDGGSGGTGTFAGEVGDGEDGRHRVRVAPGSVLVVTVEPDDDLDAVVAFELGEEDAERVERLYRRTPLEEAATADDGEVLRTDVGFEGEEEVAFLAVPFEVSGTVVVSGFEGSEGGYEVEIEAVDLGLDEDADGEDLLDALVANRDVPRDVRSRVEALVSD